MKKILPSLLLCLTACVNSPIISTVDTRPTPANLKQAAKPIKVEQPCFPMKAVRTQAEGWVQVEFSLDENGRAIEIISVYDSPPGLFENCALSSIKHWIFEIPEVYSLSHRYQFVFEFKLG